jgi:uncharacterized membrane protein
VQVIAAILALVGFILMARGLFMSKRYYKRKPRHLWSGAMCLVAAFTLLWIEGGGTIQL